MLSEASWITLHKAFTCAMLPKSIKITFNMIFFFLCNVVWSLLANIAQGFYLRNVGLWLQTTYKENKYNIVLTVLGQHGLVNV